MKKLSSILITLMLTSACSLGGFQKIQIDTTNPSDLRIATNNELNALQSRGTLKSSDKLYIANLGVKNGGQFLTKINFNSFKTKASVDGVPAKVSSDVTSVDVYLLKLPSNYNPVINKDPMDLSQANVFWSKPNVAKNGSEINLLFTGLPGDSSKHYYVGVVAKDSLGNIISKNGFNWTGETSSHTGFNISSSGVGVNQTTLEVSSTDPLSIAVNLLDAVGAKIDTTVNITNGTNTLPSVSGSLYNVASKIAFVGVLSSDPNNFNVGTMNTDGQNIFHSFSSNSPSSFVASSSLSPDKSKIVFSLFTPGSPYNIDLYIVNSDGSGSPINLTNTPDTVIENYASWSPDGSKIVFAAGSDPTHTEIYTINANGSNLTQITTSSGWTNYTPSWSSDGSKVAFASNEDGDFEIYTKNSDGSGIATKLTDNSVPDFSPVWSPDGSKIIYSSELTKLNLMNSLDGSSNNLVLNTAPTFNVSVPTQWMQSSNKIVLTNFTNSLNNSSIYTILADGSNLTQISDNAYQISFTSLPFGALIYNN